MSTGKGNKVVLSWNASSDNVGVAGYRVFRNGAQVATVTKTTYSDTLPKKTTSATYTVVAFDAAGNVSAPADSVAFRK